MDKNTKRERMERKGSNKAIRRAKEKGMENKFGKVEPMLLRTKEVCN